MLKNPWEFKRQEDGAKKALSLRKFLEIALGHRPMLSASKRLLPPMAMANARIYATYPTAKNKFIAQWDGDLDFYNQYRALARVAEMFNVTLHVLHESGEQSVWSSATPDLWLGWAPENLKRSEAILPVTVRDVYPYFRRLADASREQWMIDHGFKKEKKAKRNEIGKVTSTQREATMAKKSASRKSAPKKSASKKFSKKVSSKKSSSKKVAKKSSSKKPASKKASAKKSPARRQARAVAPESAAPAADTQAQA